MNGSSNIVVWYWGQRGGGASFSYYLADNLRRDDRVSNVTMALSANNELLPQIKASKIYTLLQDPSWARGLGTTERVRRVFHHLRFALELRRQNPAALVIGMNFPLAWPLVLLARGQNTRVTYVCHDAYPHPGDYQIRWQIWSQRLLLLSVDHVLALSHVVAAELKARGLAGGKVTVLPIGAIAPTAESGEVSPPSRPLPDPGAPLRLLFLGRLIAYKGLDLLAEAIKGLSGRDDWRLTISGSGPLEAFVVEHFSSNPRVTIELGWSTPQRFAQILTEHDVLLCPYTEASQSGVIPEAARLGIPAIVSPQAGLIEQIAGGDAGVAASNVTAPAFTDAIIKLLNDRDLVRHLGAAAASRPRDNTFATAIERILKPLV